MKQWCVSSDGHEVEYCNVCEREIELRWDINRDGFQAICPVCGSRLMLCDACMHRSGDYVDDCDYSSEHDCCMFSRPGDWWKKDSTNTTDIVIGEQYGWWTVVKCLVPKKDHYASYWSCKCRCGRKRRLSDYMLIQYREQRTQYNGCSFCESEYYKNHPILVQDGKKLPLYSAWINIRNRCCKPNNKSYKDYGGRGITICEEWKDDFWKFYDYVSKLDHYGEPGRSLDRIDNNSGYHPGNVRWATAKEQANNTRRSKKYRETEKYREAEKE